MGKRTTGFGAPEDAKVGSPDCEAVLVCLIVGGQFRTITCRQIRLAHSSVCQGSHTLAHPSDLRLGKGCKTLLSLSALIRRRVVQDASLFAHDLGFSCGRNLVVDLSEAWSCGLSVSGRALCDQHLPCTSVSSTSAQQTPWRATKWPAMILSCSVENCVATCT